ncbi:MAG: hypothetical protein CM1200mP41_10810 [Gammaproteobacteria bacterium]|nr:MAG: hypothetical protein CM1200mP41_10810 [Gammaproteobacteria bacterium]
MLKETLGNESRGYSFSAVPMPSLFSNTRCIPCPRENADSIGTSTLFAAWNAAIYAGQIDDERLEGSLRKVVTQRLLRKFCMSTMVCGFRMNPLWSPVVPRSVDTAFFFFEPDMFGVDEKEPCVRCICFTQ